MQHKNRLKDIGEFRFINQIRRLIKTDSFVIQGIGDDAAVLKYSKDKYLLFTCDMIIEDIHFTLKMKPEDIGHKALACNISDIASMGGVPWHAIISLGLPINLDVSFINRIYKGIYKLAKEFHINIVGGDTNKSKKLIINIALLGEVEKNKLVLRSRACVGDWIFVSGFLGGSFKSNRHLKFIPRLKEARFLVENYKLNSMIDISDGLILDLSHILESSGVGAVIYEEMIPKYKNATIKEVLYEGEDYELLFSLSQREAKRLINSFTPTPVPTLSVGTGSEFRPSETSVGTHTEKTSRDSCLPTGKISRGVFTPRRNFACFTHIGKITDEKSKIKFIDKNQRIKILKPKGYAHF